MCAARRAKSFHILKRNYGTNWRTNYNEILNHTLKLIKPIIIFLAFVACIYRYIPKGQRRLQLCAVPHAQLSRVPALIISYL